MAGILGLELCEDAQQAFGRTKLRGERGLAWAVLRVDDEKHCRVECTSQHQQHPQSGRCDGGDKGDGDAAGEAAQQWGRMVGRLPEDGCRYVVANMEYESATDGVARNKLVLVMWAPAGASGRDKMMTTMYVSTLKRALEAHGGGISATVQANGRADVERGAVLERVLARCTVR